MVLRDRPTLAWFPTKRSGFNSKQLKFDVFKLVFTTSTKWVKLDFRMNAQPYNSRGVLLPPPLQSINLTFWSFLPPVTALHRGVKSEAALRVSGEGWGTARSG